ncbi:protein N-terminal asparagine amidohydrolase isoform X2 [Morus notabilis]|uniref:protein N-terminal asparagine amidohydrolase isoform X2 n=1 Tax=Morus notabilis TaxID=981085 RepID=UPI000CED2F52|nr:protein N-terminal asparagine amidohydrolase isoform X2 [Morus notabilis]
MIFVDGAPFDFNSSSSEKILFALMEHPSLVSASKAFKAIPERKFSLAEESGTERPEKSKWVYLFQREYATVDPALVDFVGTDEATTCVGFAIRDRKNGMVSVAHMDSPNVVDKGLNQMLSTFVHQSFDDDLDVHVIGAFEDSSSKHDSSSSSSESDVRLNGYSLPLCTKIIKSLRKRTEKFHLQTLFVLARNTWRDSEENAHPIFSGFVVETSTGSVIPARFDNTSRCPDEMIRRIRASAAYEDRKWDGKLLETYDTQTDTFKIAPCRWSTENQERIARFLRAQSDSYILLNCSTSPFAEAPDFVQNERKKWDYLIENPDWRKAFPMEQPHVFERTGDGGWTRSTHLVSSTR